MTREEAVMNKEAVEHRSERETVPGRIPVTELKDLKQLVEDADDDTIVRVVITEDEPDEGNGAEKAE